MHPSKHSAPNASAPPTNSCELSLFWAAAIVLQYLSQLDWISRLVRDPFGAATIAQTITVLLAAATLLRPSNHRLLLTMALSQVAAGWINLPQIPNHRLFTTLFDLTLLASAVSLTLSKQRLTIDTLWGVARPFTQRLLVTLYLFAAFAKLNSTYLLSAQSCGVQLYYEIGDHIPVPQTPALALFSAWSGILIELSLPLLLLLSLRHRHKAILAGLLFHFVIAIDSYRHFSDFSAVSTAALLTFAAQEILTGSTMRFLGRLLIFGAVLSVWTGLEAVRAPGQIGFFFLTRDLLWLAYASTVIVSAIRSRLSQVSLEAEPSQPAVSGWTRALVAVPLLVAIINGLSPYLGFKTRSVWDMYSNLQFAGPHSNHLVIPRSLDLLGELREPITILQSTNPLLTERYQSDSYDIVPFELRKIFADDPSGVTSFRWSGETYERYPHSSGHLPLSEPPHWLLRKLLWFRQVDQNPEPRCQW